MTLTKILARVKAVSKDLYYRGKGLRHALYVA
ncbi:Uncharacterised protein [Klebsiella grimontii]|uniref:Uncharacterized protein n=1 Tax=Klebsiella grimontii TaxID=2058152 RepID=A0A7H4PC01_9ENTR|nr:Uncharacterised protein [Klebsiella grimontii]